MKLWIDDIRPAPEGYFWVKSVNEAKDEILRIPHIEEMLRIFRATSKEDRYLIDLDHDAGEYAEDGGDYINLLNWLEATYVPILQDSYQLGTLFVYHIHSMNPVGVENMRRIIRRNGWKEI